MERCQALLVMLQILLGKAIPRLILVQLYFVHCKALLFVANTLQPNKCWWNRVIMKWDEDQGFYVEEEESVAWSILGNLLHIIQSGKGLQRGRISLAGSIIHVVANLLVESSALVFKMQHAVKSIVGKFSTDSKRTKRRSDASGIRVLLLAACLLSLTNCVTVTILPKYNWI